MSEGKKEGVEYRCHERRRIGGVKTKRGDNVLGAKDSRLGGMRGTGAKSRR